MKSKVNYKKIALIATVTLLLATLVGLIVVDIMNNLGASGNSFAAILEGDSASSTGAYTEDNPRFKAIMDGVLTVIYVLLIAGPALATIFVVGMGIAMARAENEEARKTAKTRMVNTLIGTVIVVVLLVILMLYFKNYQTINDALRNLFGRGVKQPSDVNPE